MINHDLAHLALRNQLLQYVGPTTGVAALSATSTGFARTTGSFLTDGFRVGMEVQSSGFSSGANNGYGILTAVSALSMMVRRFAVTTFADGTASFDSPQPANSTEAEGAGRTIRVVLPRMMAWQLEKLDPLATITYLKEELVPGAPPVPVTFPINGGQTEEQLEYVMQWYGLAGVGPWALRGSVEKLKTLFPLGYTFTVGSDTLRVFRQRTSQPLPVDGGWVAMTFSLTLVGRSHNPV